MRYRHTDSDIFRNARQQEFLREAAQQPAVDELKSIGAAEDFLGTMRSYFRFDKKFLSRRNLAGMIKTAIYLAIHHAPVNQISLASGITESEDPAADTRLYISNERLQKAYDQFMTGGVDAQPEALGQGQEGLQEAGQEVVERPRAGERPPRWARTWPSAPARRLKTLPFYFPELRTDGSRYANDTPRVYSLRDEKGKLRRAYRIVIATGAPGEYYGVQGMTWRNPPGFEQPDRVREVNGRKLLLYYDGSRLRQIGWRTPRGFYYVTNTLNRRLSNAADARHRLVIAATEPVGPRDSRRPLGLGRRCAFSSPRSRLP